jgi:hypothetical protein
VLRIRDVYLGSRIRIVSILYPGSGTLFLTQKFTYNKNLVNVFFIRKSEFRLTQSKDLSNGMQPYKDSLGTCNKSTVSPVGNQVENKSHLWSLKGIFKKKIRMQDYLSCRGRSTWWWGSLWLRTPGPGTRAPWRPGHQGSSYPRG